MSPQSNLRIIHCFRSPVGGIFRHVSDLVRIQNANGHEVGILCDSLTGGAHEERLIEAILPELKLGLYRIPMRRTITPGDIAGLVRAYQKVKNLEPDILHSHGAKGGAYARIIGTLMKWRNQPVARLYCPHGGSIHYDPSSLKGKLFFFLERRLESITDRLIFVSNYEKEGYIQKIGRPKCPDSLVYNGLQQEEFEPVPANEDAADFLYIGMMRDLKGPDLFLDALAMMIKSDYGKLNAHMVGEGPDRDKYIQQAKGLGISDHVRFHDAMPAREAFAMARTVVVPSRAESMPYIVLEAIAANKPVIATRVGGIPEIFADEQNILVQPDDAEALRNAMISSLTEPELQKKTKRRAEELKRRFSVEVMAESVEQAYHQTL